MNQKSPFNFSFIFICILLNAICTASRLQQHRFQRKLDELDLELLKERIQRKEEISVLYSIMTRIEERLNKTSLNVEKEKLEEVPASAVALDNERIAEVLNEFFYLKKGLRDEKRLATRLREQVDQLNMTMGQFISQSTQTVDDDIKMVHHELDEVKSRIHALEMGQEERSKVVDNIQDNLERYTNETKRLLEKMEIVKQEAVKTTHKEPEYTSCMELMVNGRRKSGVYGVILLNKQPVNVYCDQTTDGGGWTVFQRRQDGRISFYRTWLEYKNGFGDLENEFWLGNDNLHELPSVKDRYQLRIDMLDENNNPWYAQYDKFKIGSEAENYILTIGNYSGTSGDAMWYHAGRKFSTRDVDNDVDIKRHCAEVFKGGWWYNYCHWANLNGICSASDLTGIRWFTYERGNTFLKKIEMKFRAVKN